MNKFIKKNVDLTSTAKPFNLANINHLGKELDVPEEKNIELSYLEKKEIVDKIEEEKGIKKVEKEVPTGPITQEELEEASKEIEKVINYPLTKKQVKKYSKFSEENEKIMTERKTGKQRKADLFTRHTIIVRKEYLRFFQAMSRLNDNISLTDTIDAIFRYVIDNMSEEDVKKVRKKMNERLSIFDTLRLNND